MDDIRYIQRFENFKKSFLLLEEAINITSPNIFEKAGVIQFFEITFELSWKLMKDYLDYTGIIVNTPRDAIKESCKIEIILNGEVWMNILKNRNLTVHTYNEKIAEELYKSIKLIYGDF